MNGQQNSNEIWWFTSEQTHMNTDGSGLAVPNQEKDLGIMVENSMKMLVFSSGGKNKSVLANITKKGKEKNI